MQTMHADCACRLHAADYGRLHAGCMQLTDHVIAPETVILINGILKNMRSNPIRDEIERKIQRSLAAAERAKKLICTIEDGASPEVICTQGVRYIAVIDYENNSPPEEFIDFAIKRHIVMWDLDSDESRVLLESLGMEEVGPVTCPLIYDVIAEDAVVIGMPYTTTVNRLGG